MANESLTQARAVLRGSQMSASKAREVLDLVRGKSAVSAMNTLMMTDRGASEVVAKVLRSAVANAQHRFGVPPEELYIAETFADEGPTLKRFRPRARGRAGRIRKRTCHITVVVERLPEEKLRIIREKQRADSANRRSRRVRSSRRSQVAEEAQSALDEVASSPVTVEEPATQEIAAVDVSEEVTPEEAVSESVNDEVNATESTEEASNGEGEKD